MTTTTLESPAARAAPAARDVLENALLALRDLPRRVDRAPIRSALEEAMALLSAWGESRLLAQDHLILADRAAEAIGRAATLVRPFAEKSVVARRLARSLDKLHTSLGVTREKTAERLLAEQNRAFSGRTLSRNEAPPDRPFVASAGFAALHTLPGRPKIRPPISVDANESDDDADDDDDEPRALESGAKGVIGDADPGWWDEVAHIRGLARDCMEDIAGFGNLRRRNEDESWTDVATFEGRLCDNLDAFISLGHTGPECEAQPELLKELFAWTDPGFIDKGRAFAAAFVLGCIEGEDAARAAVLALERAHPSTYASYADALVLGSSPSIRRAVERLLGNADAALVSVALEILRRRREVSFAPVALLLGHPDIELARGAALALGFAQERGPAALTLVRVLEDPDVEGHVALAAAESAILLGAPEGLRFVRTRLAEENAEAGSHAHEFVASALRLLSLAGNENDKDMVRSTCGADEAGVIAIGWFGEPGHVPALLDWLEAASELSASVGYPSPLEVRIVEALHRITGAPLRVPQSEIPLTEVTTDLALDPRVWRNFWNERGHQFVLGKRYRFGTPYTPAASVEELASEGATVSARRNCAFEVALMLDEGRSFDPETWVVRQQQVLGILREQAARSNHPAGRWPGRTR